jgi:molybdopterin converting factor small subunit
VGCAGAADRGEAAGVGAINILIRYHGIFAAIAACREERLALDDGASTGDALRLVGRRHPALAEALFLSSDALAPYARPFVNGALADDLSRPLRDGDEIALLPALSGGMGPRARHFGKCLARDGYNQHLTSPRAAATISAVCGST